MRLLACDFDGTLFRERTVSREDIVALAAFRKAGNVFGIVTGRGAMTLMRELERHSLRWDFLLCNNGALLLDEQGRLTAARSLPEDVTRRLLEHEVTASAASTALFDGLAMHVLEGGGRWLNPVYDPPFMSREKALCTSFVQISYGFFSRAEAFAWGGRLAAEMEGQARVQCSISVADVTALEAGKAAGIAWACAERGWDPGEIITCGDDENEVEMLKHCRGWAMAGGDESVCAAAVGTVSSIAELLRISYDPD